MSCRNAHIRCPAELFRPGQPTDRSSRIFRGEQVENLPADDPSGKQVLVTCRPTGRAISAHERNLMLGIKLIEIHVPLPGKREHDGLSVKNAYFAMPLIYSI